MTKNARFEARLPQEIKELLAQAASLQGQTLSEFVVAVSTTAARQIVREQEVIELSKRDQITFAKALLDAPEANAYLKEAARRYREETE